MKTQILKRSKSLTVLFGILLMSIALGGNFRISLSNYTSLNSITNINPNNVEFLESATKQELIQPQIVKVDPDFKYRAHLETIDPSIAAGREARIADPVDQLQAIPDKIEIPAIDLVAPIVKAEAGQIEVEDKIVNQWQVPGFYAGGWHLNSAPPGTKGNTVINGHHNAFGEVFKNLNILQVGDEIILYSQEKKFVYQVAEILILPDRFVSLEKKLENARWISMTEDERLTLVTCWPYESNTHRLIVVAFPVPDSQTARSIKQ